MGASRLSLAKSSYINIIILSINDFISTYFLIIVVRMKFMSETDFLIFS